MDYFDNYFCKQTELYTAIINKAIKGDQLTNTDIAFIKTYRNDLKKLTNDSPVDKLIKGLKSIQNFININEEEDETNGI